MAEYIEREKAKQRLVHDYAYAAANILDEIPAADVVEVVHGEWLETKYPDVYQCSECYYEWYVTGICRKTPIDNNAFYCPCCGAEMDGKGIDNG